jgi:hypothetical protein
MRERTANFGGHAVKFSLISHGTASLRCNRHRDGDVWGPFAIACKVGRKAELQKPSGASGSDGSEWIRPMTSCDPEILSFSLSCASSEIFDTARTLAPIKLAPMSLPKNRPAAPSPLRKSPYYIVDGLPWSIQASPSSSRLSLKSRRA